MTKKLPPGTPHKKRGGKAYILSEKQRTALISWIAEGMYGSAIKNLAQNFSEPFTISDQLVYSYRQTYKVDITKIRDENVVQAMTTGLALKANRLNALYRLAQLLEDDLHLRNKAWLERVKGIGSFENFERVVEEEFNEGEFKQLRGVYDDIAREVGHRAVVKAVEASGENSTVGNISGNFVLPAEMLSPAFLSVYRDIRAGAHMEYVLEGGRGSTKSSFVSEIIIYLLMNNPGIHALACRQVADTMRDSVYAQILWAINELGLSDKFKCTTSPMEMTYIPTGQKIYFRGANDPGKIKSIKTPFGHIGILWFEELDQFHGPEAIRKIEQSVIRGGEEAWIFKSFNPPKTSGNWANKYVRVPKASQLHHRSDYTTVPIEWLGQPFLDEAEHLKKVNPKAYDHEYLGIVNGTGGQVFDNIILRKITPEERSQFERPLQGIDWGYFPDPFSWGKMHYDAARHTLYIYDELRMNKAGNRKTYDELVKKKGLTPGDTIIADSAEPKSIGDYRDYGANCRGAEKGPESINYSYKWLQSLAAIIIDPTDAPAHAEEFSDAELEQDKDGNYISEYPDKNNHAIDDTRYATNMIWRRRGQ